MQTSAEVTDSTSSLKKVFRVSMFFLVFADYSNDFYGASQDGDNRDGQGKTFSKSLFILEACGSCLPHGYPRVLDYVH